MLMLMLQCSSDTVVMCEFHPLDRHAIITCGKSHINFWTLDGNGTLYKRMGIFENRDKPKFVTSLAFTQSGDVLSGDSNGNIIVWGRGESPEVMLGGKLRGCWSDKNKKHTIGLRFK